MNQPWFEMSDFIKKSFDKSVWVPLREVREKPNKVNFGKVGYEEEFIGHGSILIPVSKKSNTEILDWNNIGINRIHGINFFSGEYSEVDKLSFEDFSGIHLVLNQSFDNNFDHKEWHLHQDLVISLGLKREGDTWVCPKEGYVEVAILERDETGNPNILRIKNQFLKDYLYARSCGLYITSYYSRDFILPDRKILSWEEDSKQLETKDYYWECRVMEIHEGGFPFGEKLAISHAGRTDIDEDEDVPDISTFPTDDNIDSSYEERSFNGKKLYRIIAEVWKNEWTNPGNFSSFVLGENQPVELFYFVDVDGSKQSNRHLLKGGKWLWFKPELISTLLNFRGSNLTWYSKDTGSVACSPSCNIHFGINDLGLITVYAKDICNLPFWQQQIWAGFNVPPEGGVSKELQLSQIKSVAPDTVAPEAFLQNIMTKIDNATFRQFNFHFFRNHQSVSEIIPTIHRFRAVDEKSIFSLAKDIARIIVDDINLEALQKIAIPPKKTTWKSLKTVENLLAIKVSKESARNVLTPLVGVYELRHGDAHLPGSEIQNSFDLIKIDRQLPFVIQGYQMLWACVDHLHMIYGIIDNWHKMEDVLE